MPFTRRYATWACLALAAVLLAGCPFGAKLSVSPLSLTLGGATTSANFRIENAGSGTLNYTVTENLPWIDILPASGGKQSGQVTGSVTNNVAFVQVVLNQANLPATGTVRGDITIESNGGQEIVTVAAQQSGQPVLLISRTSIDFGLTGTAEQFTITNNGNGQLQWTLSKPAGDSWISAQPSQGTLDQFGQQTIITVDVNREGIAARPEAYTSTISLLSNGGNADVAVSMNVPGLSVQPTQVDFGRTEGVKTQSLTVSNNGSAALALSVTAITDSGGNWLSVDNAAPTLPSPGPLQIAAIANATGLAPGNYTGSIRVSAPSISYTQVVPVTLSVPGFTYAPAKLDFGTLLVPGQQQITLTNQGATPINWQAALSPGAAWLSLSQSSGTLAAPQTITVTADPRNVNPGPYNATITFTYDGGQDIVAVTMVKPKPAALKVAPQDLDFGVTRTETMVGIWNDGVGTINWSIDTTSFPAWLILQPVNGAGIASGTVSGDQTDTVTIRVDRSLAPPDQKTYQFSFNVTATGDSTTAVPVTVRASAPQLPEFVVTGDGIDGQGIPYILLNITETDKEFIISNIGQGALNWNVDPQAILPTWLTSITPSQGTVNPGKQEIVRVTINRTGLPRTGAVFRLPLLSNDPANPLRYIEIQVRVPFTMTILARPSSIAFGRYAITTTMAVANGGDEGETLRFRITSTQPNWLFVEPTFGSSVGVPPTFIPDWQTISVAIDRSKIPGEAGVAKLIIEAIDVPSDALPVTPVEIPVSVDIAPLTVEASSILGRVPSLMRVNAILRDSAFRPFASLLDTADPRTMYDVTNVRVSALEDSQPVETSEVPIIVKKNENLPIDIMILLDYSGSMRKAADTLVENGQIIVPAGSDSLTQAYIQCIGPMIDEFMMWHSAEYRVALAVFNERRNNASNLRIIHGADIANPALANVDFVQNAAVLQHRLKHMEVLDNGASPMLPAFVDAAYDLFTLDLDENLVPYDAAPEKILIAVTDGRRTTPSMTDQLTPTSDYLWGGHVRLFSVGWGQNVLANALITLSGSTGGHYYGTSQIKNTEGVEIPQISELLNWCRTDAATLASPYPQSIPQDLRSHISVSYPTLNEKGVAALEERFEVLDVTPPVSGSIIYKSVKTDAIPGDVTLGQIGMRTTGLGNGALPDTTSVFIYMDYAPRNLGAFTAQIALENLDAGATSQIIQTPTDNGGLIADWTLTGAGPYTFTAPVGRTLRYGDYGELVEIRVTGAVNPFTVRLGITDPVIGPNPDTKYFTYPDTILVNNEPFRATSFPRPFVKNETPPPPFNFMKPFDTIILPNIILPVVPPVSPGVVGIYNLGGSYVPAGAQLHWSIKPAPELITNTNLGSFDYLINGLPPVPAGNLTGLVSATEAPSMVTFTPITTGLTPGLYEWAFYIEYDYYTVGNPDVTKIQGFYYGIMGPYFIRYTVQ